MMKTIVTSYQEPDLDGVSSMYAYVEYLNKKGIESDYYICGSPKKEVEIVCNLFDISLKGTTTIHSNQDIILVDINNMQQLPFLNPQNVIEIIDHHFKSVTNEICPRAKIQIERLGAVATLIAEKFKSGNVPISRESAILLYYGIISNSINLKANFTSPRDIEMVNWLETQCNAIDKEKIKTIFEQKSQIKEENLRKEMEAEISFNYKGKSITIAQLEVVNIENFLHNYKEKIVAILEEIKQEKTLDYIFINCVDILNGFTTILTIDSKTEEILTELFGYRFNNRICQLDRLVQRKELSKVLKEKNYV